MTLQKETYGTTRWLDRQTDFAVLDLMFLKFFAWFCDNIYFFSGRYGCSNVAAADVADVDVAVGPVFVACYHCHLPRSSYKHGASLKAPYPLRISQFFFYFGMKENSVGFSFLDRDIQVAETTQVAVSDNCDSTSINFCLDIYLYPSLIVESSKGNWTNCFCNFISAT